MAENCLIIERVFDAPRERVWQAWSDPEWMKCWMGPKGYTIPVCRVDFRVGGSNLTCMRSAEGQDYWSTGSYLEIEPFERIVTTDSFSDAAGNVIAPSVYGMGDDFPREMLLSLTFTEVGGKTRMTLVHDGMPAGEHSDAARVGWNESFNKLDDCLKRAE